MNIILRELLIILSQGIFLTLLSFYGYKKFCINNRDEKEYKNSKILEIKNSKSFQKRA